MQAGLEDSGLSFRDVVTALDHFFLFAALPRVRCRPQALMRPLAAG